MSTGQNLHSGELFVRNKQKDGQTNMDEHLYEWTDRKTFMYKQKG